MFILSVSSCEVTIIVFKTGADFERSRSADAIRAYKSTLSCTGLTTKSKHSFLSILAIIHVY